jgi:hypothetical protein
MMTASNRLKPVYLALIADAFDALSACHLPLSGAPSIRWQQVADGDLECVLRV